MVSADFAQKAIECARPSEILHGMECVAPCPCDSEVEVADDVNRWNLRLLCLLGRLGEAWSRLDHRLDQYRYGECLQQPGHCPPPALHTGTTPSPTIMNTS